jgi:hypothetical protein
MEDTEEKNTLFLSVSSKKLLPGIHKLLCAFYIIKNMNTLHGENCILEIDVV